MTAFFIPNNHNWSDLANRVALHYPKSIWQPMLSQFETTAANNQFQYDHDRPMSEMLAYSDMCVGSGFQHDGDPEFGPTA